MPRPRSPRLQQALQATLRRAVALACLAAVPAHAQETTRGPAAAAADDPAAVAAPASGRADGGDRCAIETVVDPRIEELLQANPDDPRIDITSDTGDLGRAGDASLSGNVTIRMGQRLLTADQATVDAEQRSIELKGDVEYLDPQMNVRGKGGSFQQGGRGEFSGAEFRLHDSSVRGAAQNASLSPSGNIKLEGVRYTACPPGNEDWSLGAGAIEIDQESRIGTGRDVRIDFLGVPIFYTPWISFPVGDQPKSGLLFPTVGSSSRSGTQVAVPYYWFLAPNYDATLTTRWYSSRGLRLDPELRFLSERSRSQLNVEYLIDDRERGGSRGVIDWRHVTRFAPRTRLLIDDHRVVVEVLLQAFPQLERVLVEGDVAGHQVVRPDDRGIAADIAAADVPFLLHGHVARAVVLRQVIRRGEAVAATADDDEVVRSSWLRVAPGRSPAAVATQRFPQQTENRVSGCQRSPHAGACRSSGVIQE